MEGKIRIDCSCQKPKPNPKFLENKRKIKYLQICKENPSNYLIVEWDNDFAVINSGKIIKDLQPNEGKPLIFTI